MTNKEILTVIANVHNRLTEISVRGDDAIRMAEVLNICRTLARNIQDNIKSEDKAEEGIQLGE